MFYILSKDVYTGTGHVVVDLRDAIRVFSRDSFKFDLLGTVAKLLVTVLYYAELMVTRFSFCGEFFFLSLLGVLSSPFPSFGCGHGEDVSSESLGITRDNFERGALARVC